MVESQAFYATIPHTLDFYINFKRIPSAVRDKKCLDRQMDNDQFFTFEVRKPKNICKPNKPLKPILVLT